MATEGAKYCYNDGCEVVGLLNTFKVEPMQPVLTPPGDLFLNLRYEGQHSTCAVLPISTCAATSRFARSARTPDTAATRVRNRTGIRAGTRRRVVGTDGLLAT